MEEWKEALEAAANKTIGAWNETRKAFLSHNKEAFDRWHSEFCRYVETFSHAIGISEEKFISFLEDKGLYKSETEQQFAPFSGRKVDNMDNNYFDTLKIRLYESCDQCNKCADEGDQNRNRVNYGAASAIARIMVDFGHKIDVPVWDDKGFLRIPKIIIDNEVFIDFKSE